MVPILPNRGIEPIYRPILTSARGEHDALSHLDETMAPLVAPLIEVAAPDESTRRHAAPRAALPSRLVVGVDLGRWPDPERRSEAGRAVRAELARWGVPVLPVIGLTESDERTAAYGDAARTALDRAVIRLRARRDRGGPDATTGAVERIWRLTRLVPEQCDLVIDLADVCCAADVRTAEPRARRLVEWARRHAWRSVTVAAGAMPPTLRRLPVDEPVRLPRWDRILWRRLADLGVGYGDYGTGSAVSTPGTGKDRLPTIRYTTEETWWVYRWSRRGGRGDSRFTDLCQALVSAPYWPAEGGSFSWGDHEILRRARRAAGPGSSANWTAWDTSHHLAQILTELGAHSARCRTGHGCPKQPRVSRYRSDRPV